MKKKKSKGCLLIVVLLLLLAVIGTFFWMTLSKEVSKMKDESLLVVTDENRDSLVIQADQVEFQVNRRSETLLKVTSYNKTEGMVVVKDENGLELLSMELRNTDGQGVATGTLVIDEHEARKMKLTAVLGEETSAPLNLYISPKVTVQMIATCVQVSQELGDALIEAGYEKIDEDAVNTAEQWLLNDERVSDVVRMDNGIFFYTTDGIAGCCQQTPEEGMLGSSGFSQGETDSIDTFKRWEKRGKPFVEEYIASANTLTNDSILVLQPIYDSKMADFFSADTNEERSKNHFPIANPCHTEEYAKIAGKLAKNLDSKTSERYINADASCKIINQTINQYGIVIMNTHGMMIGKADTPLKEKTWSFQLQDGMRLDMVEGMYVEFEKYLTDILGLDSEKIYPWFFSRYYTDEEVYPEDCLLYINVALEQAEIENLKNAGTDRIYTNLALCGTHNMMELLYQNKKFDNSIVYFGCCYSLSNPSVGRFYLNRGAVAYLGYEDAVKNDVEFKNADDFFEDLVKEKNKTRWKNVTEASTDKIDIFHTLSRPTASFIDLVFMKNGWTDQMLYGLVNQPEFTLHGIGTLEGKVLEKDSDEPVSNAVVQLYHWFNQEFVLEKESVTDENGVFKMDDMLWGVYVAKVTTEDGIVTYANCIFADKETVAEPIYVERNLSYYPYIYSELEPEMGLFNLGESKFTAHDFADYDWDQRTGIVSAAIEDMNGDGVEDMVLLHVIKENYRGKGMMRQTLYADMYTMENGMIVKKNSLPLGYFNNCENHELWVSMFPYQNTDGEQRCDLFIQSYAEGCFVDYRDPVYARFSFDGEGLRKVFHVEQSHGGTSEMAFSNYVYNSKTGREEVEIIWGDLLYLDFGGVPGIYNTKGLVDITDVMNQFMREHMPVAVQSQQGGFPSYIGSQNLKSVAVFGNNGPNMGGEFTMAVADDTALREELEKLNK